jgi:hypothetical protein
VRCKTIRHTGDRALGTIKIQRKPHFFILLLCSGHSSLKPRLPIPNRTVKRVCADDSVHARIAYPYLIQSSKSLISLINTQQYTWLDIRNGTGECFRVKGYMQIPSAQAVHARRGTYTSRYERAGATWSVRCYGKGQGIRSVP